MSKPPGADRVPSASSNLAPSKPKWDPSQRSTVGLDLLILLAFLTVAFLLGVFPINDTDFWWHLRTGDLIRQSGQIPRVDPFLFGGPKEKPWTDLHWGFQVLISIGHELGGIDLLTLGKCAIITLAIAVLILARPRRWPMEVMTLAGLPALLLLGGRMYVRPEILSLMYLSITFVLISNWRNRPWLSLLLPLVMALWVNSHALFVLGLIIIGCGLVDAATQPGAWTGERKRWWKIVVAGAILSGFACLLNPYGLQGTLFPLKLLGTMANPIFAETIAELESVPHFLTRAGWYNPNALLLLGTQILGALSFLIPIGANTFRAIRRTPAAGDTPEPEKPASRTRATRKATAKQPAKRGATSGSSSEPDWHPSVFRLLIFMIFSLLSWRATRNSQQFAAVALAVTAWNLGEWVAFRRTRTRVRNSAQGLTAPPERMIGKFTALGILVTVGFLVVSGGFYRWLGEGRKFGLGEQPLWFPHEAVIAAGSAEMPDRFVCFHNGHAALWDYHNGPQKQTYTDARLEVVGPELYREYLDLQGRLAMNKDWNSWFQRNGRPGLLIDLVQESSPPMVANALAHPDWRCVWFDPMAAVFVPQSSSAAAQAINFSDRHFQSNSETGKGSAATLLAESKATQDVAMNLLGPVVDSERTITRAPRRDLAALLLMNAHGLAHRALKIDGGSANSWKALGVIASLRNGSSASEGVARFRKPYDPLLDLERMRAIAALRKSLNKNPDGFSVLFTLATVFQDGKMIEAAIPVLEQLSKLWAINSTQRDVQARLPQLVTGLKSQLGPPAASSWKNLSELDQQVNGLLEHGRVESAANLLESAYPLAGRPWEVSNRIGTLRLHLGDTEGARRVWAEAPDAPRQALKNARIALTYLLDENEVEARALFQQALESEPAFFEALYSLAVLETDASNRAAAHEAAQKATQAAPGPAAQFTLRELQALIGNAGAGEKARP